MALTRLIEKFDFAQHDTQCGYMGGQTLPLQNNTRANTLVCTYGADDMLRCFRLANPASTVAVSQNKLSPKLQIWCNFGDDLFFFKLLYINVKCLRRSAVSTLSEAIGFRPRNVVRLFSSANDITSNNFAIHSSANAFCI